MAESFDDRWDAFAQRIDNARHPVPTATAPLVLEFLSERVADVLWTQMDAKRIKLLHRLIGAAGPSTRSKRQLIMDIDKVITAARQGDKVITAARQGDEELERKYDPPVQPNSSESEESAEAAAEFFAGIQPPRTPTVSHTVTVTSPPGVAAAARDLPRVYAAGPGVRSQSLAPVAGAPVVRTRVRGDLSSDPIDLDDGSDDDGKEEDVNARTMTQEAVQDLGAVALQALMDLNMTASEWLSMTDRERPWKTARNHHEAVNIVRIFDQIGLRSNNFIRSLMLKRIIALQHFDQTGNVNVLDVVQGSAVELLPQKMINAIYTQLQRRTQSQAKASTSTSDSNRRSNKRGRNSPGSQQSSQSSNSSSNKKPRGPPPSGGAAASQ